MKHITIFFAFFAIIVAEKKIPHYIKTCSRNDPSLNECFANNANIAIKYIAQGDKQYDIAPLLPSLKWRELLIVDMPPFKLMLLEVEALGIENMTVVDPRINLEEQKIQFTLSNPKIIWKSKYAAEVDENGQNVQTDGTADIIFHDGNYTMLIEYTLVKVNGLEYANVTKYGSEFSKGDIDFKLTNLDSNPIIENEWAKVKKNFINKQVTVACAQVVADYINKIFNVVPFKNIFPTNNNSN